MSESDLKQTRIMERPKLGGDIGTPTPQAINKLCGMIQTGEEPRRIFGAIIDNALAIPNVEAAALYLPSDRRNTHVELLTCSGNFVPQGEVANNNDVVKNHAQGFSRIDQYYEFDIVCLGAAIGQLTIKAKASLSLDAVTEIRMLAHHASVTYERQKLSNTLQHFLDRLEVLNELNQLIASNIGLQRIVKSLARESAFRFAADVSLAFLINEDGNALEVKGGYGCAPSLVPKSIPIDKGILGQVLRLGGQLSISNLKNHQNSGLEFLEQLQIKSIDCCCLEVRGDALGVIVIGFKRESQVTENDLTRFEEFCQGAGVAIANAITQDRVTSYTERLEELVEQRTADLAFQTARAEEANSAKSRFLANMSHELRTPLTAIVGYSSILADGVFGALSDKQKDALNAVVRSSDHLKKLIDDVLSMARIESGKEDTKAESVSAAELLQHTHKIMMQQALQKGIQLIPLELDDTIQNAHIYADQKHLNQIIINLMSNAVKYTPPGGTVRVTAELISDKIKIGIIDSGVGMTKQKLEKLFDRFERGEDTYSREQEGTGIGLNLTKRLIELNGGRIAVESEINKGSSFWVLLPLASAEQGKQITAPDGHHEMIRLDGLSTIVVDDNQDTLDMLTHILSAAGASVKTATSVKSGMELLQADTPDIIVTDLAMPGQSGLELIQQVRTERSQFGMLPIVVLSACAFDQDRSAALDAGASIFMAKPFRPIDILQTVRQLTLASAMSGK